MDYYRYQGAVTQFGRCVANNWVGETCAVSPQKAKSNLVYKYKRDHNLAATSKIELPGKVIKII